MENIELISRRHLNIETVSVESGNVRKVIVDEVLQSESVLSCWESVAHCIPTKYELYSLELLKCVTDLWITIRGHSFAKEVTSKSVKKNKKGTRKTLKDTTNTCKSN